MKQGALITGAGRGIGKAIAERLARDGVGVVIADREIDLATETAAEINHAGGTAFATQVDVTDEGAAQRSVEMAVREFGQLDILVNNAGIVIAKPVLKFEESEWRQMFDVNVYALVRFAQEAARHMVARGSGVIINIASEAAKTVRPSFTMYATTKIAVLGFTRGLAAELAPNGVRVNAICPGIVDTKMWDDLDRMLSVRRGVERGSVLGSRKAEIPLGRLSVPEDVAGVVAFLVSKDAEYMTGQAINVTGGREQH